MKYLLTIIAAISVSLEIPGSYAIASPQLRGVQEPGNKSIRQDSTSEPITKIRRSADMLEKLGKQSAGQKLSKQQRNEALKYDRWLANSSQKLRAFADRWENRLKQASGNPRESGRIIETFNSEHLRLQQKMQGDNRKFTTISNIMKTKHDTAKAAINNIR